MKKTAVQAIAESRKKILEAQDELRAGDFADEFHGCEFTWLSGREKGMIFELSGLDHGGHDAHFRGSYDNHPQFGHIPSDQHQASALYDDIERGIVKVTDGDQDRTEEAKRFVESVYADQDDGSVDDDDDGNGVEI